MYGSIYATLPASDMERARTWYSEKFGKEPVEVADDGGLLYEWGQSRFLIYPSSFAGTNQATAAGIIVADFDAAAAQLRANGVEFLTYDLGDEFPMVDGVATMPDGRKAAWFTDSEGNIISLFLDMEG
jgi:catechol 2,3-dioxygenase-like lactoylglutathione lyase family enzyme